MSSHLQQFFKLCDPGETKSADRDSFRNFCKRMDLSVKEADTIFEKLDSDGDGKIDFEDFSRGFSDYLQIAEEEMLSQEPSGQREDIESKTSEGKLKWLVEEFQSSEKRYLVPYLENAVEDFLSNIQSLKDEKEQLEKLLKREKEEHDRHLKRMEDEIDCQVKEAEMKSRLKAQADVEEQKKNLQFKMDAEMNNLQVHYALFEKLNAWLQAQPSDNDDKRLKEVRHKLDDTVHENKQLKISLLETQTNMAVMSSRLLQWQTLYEEKCRELSNEREKVQEVLHEQDHLSHQLSLLHDANRCLQDTNDTLRNFFDRPPKVESYRRSRKNGSVIGDYFDADYSLKNNLEEDDDPDLNENLEVSRFNNRNHLKKARSMDLVNLTSSKTDQRLDRSQAKHNDSPSTDRGLQEVDEGFSSTPESSLITREDDQLFVTSQCSRVASPISSPSSPVASQRCPISSPSSPVASQCSPISSQCSPVGSQCSPVGSQCSPISSHCSPVGSSTESDDRTVESQIDGPTSPKHLRTSAYNSRIESSAERDEDCDDGIGMPKKKISDIVKQLGIQGTIVKRKAPKYLDVQESYNVGLSTTDLDIIETKASIVRAEPFQVSKDSTATTLSQTAPNEEARSVSVQSDLLQTSIDLEDDLEYSPSGPSEKSFNVIFVGDAGVGKSSFALRISKGVFMRHISSTLGVDFLMRMLRVDGCNVEVQLWDTAGQERFRSITKSYFRKADGIMLLYDCTCERSFLNVRQWTEDVKSMATHQVPLMIVANKIDIRKSMSATGRTCISVEQGARLASECSATFIEASAKDGSNVLKALAKLIRSMSKNKDLSVRSSTMQLSENKPKKSSCCSK